MAFSSTRAWVAVTLFGGALAAGYGLAGCGGNVSVQFGTGGSGQGGGVGGDAGSPASSSSSGGSSPCSEDCSLIDTGPCQVAVCNEVTGQCDVLGSDAGTPCDDGAFCTIQDVCDGAGTCVGSGDNTCGLTPAGCQLVSCDEVTQSCSLDPVPNGGACTPTNVCMENGVCTNGSCVGQPKDCSFVPLPGECFTAVCDQLDGICKAIPGNNGQICIDPNAPCTVNKTCAAGVCQGGQPKDCSALDDDCTQGLCNLQGTCVPSPINQGGMCNDGNTCTTATTCTNGICGGGISTVTIFFSDDFNNNVAGWTLGNEWEIGSATASSSMGIYGNPDPAQDHTLTSDNGVAGVDIGGNADQMLHPFTWLTSPVINVGAAPAVFLEYWRWLNSDYTPWMENRVEVFDGVSWVVVWQSGGAPGIQDNAWTKQSHDISMYANAQLRVRFGFDIGQNGVFNVSSWNLDDVVVASGACN